MTSPWLISGAAGLVVAIAVCLPPTVPAPAPIAGVAAGATSSAGLGAGELARAAARIDDLIAAGLVANGVKPNPLLGDEAFCRRAYLSIIGRNPTWQEAAAFSTSTVSDKRKALVRTLVDHPGRVSHQYAFFADLLRVQTRLQDRYPGQPYIAWIKDSLRENRTWDKMVRDLLTAKGMALERGNGATGFWLRDAGMPLDHLSTTVQAFLGTQVGCAQCHDHPFDRWKRQEFFQMAAFTTGVSAGRKFPGVKGKEAEKEFKKRVQEAKLTPELRNAVRRLSETVGATVNSSPKSQIALPPDWQYPTRGKPGEMVAAHAVFDGPGVAKGEDPREVLAAWVTSPDNPRFAVVMANRIWKQVFGQGVVEPVDNFTDDTRATDPELLTWIGLVFQSTGYDIKAFTRILCETELFQRAATPRTVGELAGQPYRFPGPVLRRMTAEQTWDSLMTLLVDKIDEKQGEGAETMWRAFDENKDRSPEELLELAKDMVSTKEMANKLKADADKLQLAMKTSTPEQQKVLRESAAALRKSRDELENKKEHLAAFGKNQEKKGAGGYIRSAELPSPAPPGHLLRIFGQSDREAPNGSTDAPSVTQALGLMNSMVDKDILKDKSVLAKAVADQPQLADKARVLFLAVLGRQPTPAELRLLGVEMAVAGASAQSNTEVLKDLAWVLINSHEFRFIP